MHNHQVEMRKRHIKYGVFLLLSVVMLPVAADDCTSRPSSISSEFVEYADIGFVKLYYSPESVASASHNVDVDKDGVPDKIQNFSRQIEAATGLFNGFFDMDGPLSSEIYSDVRVIQAIVKDMPRPNGRYFSLPFYDPDFEDVGACVLRFHIADRLRIYNLTPAHELFHFYHASHTQVRRAWLREGLARWAMYAFRPGVGESMPLPQEKEELLAVMQESYGASKMWNRLLFLLDENGELEVSDDIADMQYVSGRLIISDDYRLHGVDIVRDLFRELAVAEQEFSNRYGAASFRNREYDYELDRLIWDSLVKVSLQYVDDNISEELSNFLSIKFD